MSGVAHFTTTRWTAVFSAGTADGAEAREELARTYWYPLYVFARGKGLSPEDAGDMVQTFLGRLLNGSALARVQEEGGRFRDYLRVGLLNLIRSGHRAAQSTLRRPPGGFIPWGGGDPEERFQREPVAAGTPEASFDRAWGRAVLDAALADLEEEYRRTGRGALAEHLLHFLDDAPTAHTHAQAAEQLGLAEGTVKNAMTAFRRRFRELLTLRVAATLADGALVEEELRSLQAALRG